MCTSVSGLLVRHSLIYFMIAATLAFNTRIVAAPVAGSSEQLKYPPARRADVVDDYHGTKVPDPYRWMEDMKSPETMKWVHAEDELLQNYLSQLPQREALHRRIRELTSDDVYAGAIKEGGRYFFTKASAGGVLAGLYMQDGPSATPRVLLDAAHGLGQGVQFGGFSPSPDGRLVAYTTSEAQSNSRTVRVLDIATGADLPGVLLHSNRVSAGEIWRRDSKGFFYTQLSLAEGVSADKAKLSDPKVYYYSIGEAKESLAYEPNDPTLIASYNVTADGRYLVLSIGQGSSNKTRILYKEVNKLGEEAHPLIPEGDANYIFLGSEGSVFWFYTDFKALRGRVIAVDITQPQRQNWRETIPESDAPIAANSSMGGNALGMFAGKFVLVYLKDGRPVLRVFDKQGRLTYEPSLPAAGFVWSGISGHRNDPEVLWGFLNFAGNTIYSLDVEKKTNTIFHEPKTNFDRDSIVVDQVFYPSKDGTRIPMFVAHKKGLKLDGSHPAFMYGYGAFGWVSFIWYQPFVLSWLEMGGIYVQPSIRGGGDYGEPWHQAGMNQRKQNSIDDYIAAAEWLVQNRYTSSSRLVANGGSASGGLAGAAITQRPDLFAAAVIDRPVLDMVRFDQFTQGGYWTQDFGSPHDAEEFKALYAWSPYHNLKPGTCYPPTLVMSGDRDQTAPPLHAYKFIAAMQAAQGCANPVLLKVMWGAGHAFGTTPEQTSDSWGDQMAFLVRVLKLNDSNLATLEHDSQPATRK
jgi:prolyl oligopeptidase